MMLLSNIYDYRGFILNTIVREFTVSTNKSLLGILWFVIKPLTMISIYALVFSNLMRPELEHINNPYGYAMFICSGIVLWNLFTEICSRSQGMFINNANLIKKLLFPKICLPIIATGISLINFFIFLFIFLIFLKFTMGLPIQSLLMIWPIIVVLILFAVGLGLVLSILNVFFRDIEPFWNVLLQFWFWLTPIIYPMKIIPENMMFLVNCNPLTPLVLLFQNAVIYNKQPDWHMLLLPMACALFFLSSGFLLFRKHAGEIMDEL